jgi:hypothetical protein
MAKMTHQHDIKEFAEQFRYTLMSIDDAWIFIRKYKVWSGFWRYGWVSRFFIVVAFILGLEMIGDISALIRSLRANHTGVQAFAEVGAIGKAYIDQAWNFIKEGNSQFVFMVLVEVLIFHACRESLKILGAQVEEASFNRFLRAQIRMLKVVLYAWILNKLIGISFELFFGFFPLVDFLKPTVLYLVESFFLGLVVMDNFNEQLGLTIKESIHFSRAYIGVGLVVGLLINVLMYIPIVGFIIAPLLAAVLATIVLYAETEKGHLLAVAALEETAEKV